MASFPLPHARATALTRRVQARACVCTLRRPSAWRLSAPRMAMMCSCALAGYGSTSARPIARFILISPPGTLPKATGSPPLPRFQNRACAFPFTRLLSGAALVKSTIQPTGLGDTLSALHTYLGTAGFMSYACLLAPLPSTPPLPRQRILGMTPGLGFLGDPASEPGVRLTTCSRKPVHESQAEVTPFLLGVGL